MRAKRKTGPALTSLHSNGERQNAKGRWKKVGRGAGGEDGYRKEGSQEGNPEANEGVNRAGLTVDTFLNMKFPERREQAEEWITGAEWSS